MFKNRWTQRLLGRLLSLWQALGPRALSEGQNSIASKSPNGRLEVGSKKCTIQYDENALNFQAEQAELWIFILPYKTDVNFANTSKRICKRRKSGVISVHSVSTFSSIHQVDVILLATRKQPTVWTKSRSSARKELMDQTKDFCCRLFMMHLFSLFQTQIILNEGDAIHCLIAFNILSQYSTFQFWPQYPTDLFLRTIW